MRIFIACLTLAAISACGVRGPLYRPNEAKPARADSRPVMQQDRYESDDEMRDMQENWK